MSANSREDEPGISGENNEDRLFYDGTETQTQTQTQTQPQPFSQALTQNDASGSPFKLPIFKKTSFTIKINGGAISDPKPERFKSGGIKVRSGGASTNIPGSSTDNFSQNSSQPLEEATQNDYATTQELTQASQKQHPHFTQPSPLKPLTIIQEERESFLSIQSVNNKFLAIERKQTIQHNPRIFLPPEPENRLEDETQALNDNDNIIIPATQPTNDSPTKEVENTPLSKSSPVNENQTQDLRDTGNKSYVQSSPIVIPNTPLPASQAGISPVPTPSSLGRFTKNMFDSHGCSNNFSTPALKKLQNTQQVAETQALDDEEPSSDSIKFLSGIGIFDSARKREGSDYADITPSYYKYTEDSQTIIRKKTNKNLEENSHEDLASSESRSISTSRITEKTLGNIIHPETQITDNDILFPETQATDNFFVPETQPLSSPSRNQHHYCPETQPLHDESKNNTQLLDDEEKSQNSQVFLPKTLHDKLHNSSQEVSPPDPVSDIKNTQELYDNSQNEILENATQVLYNHESDSAYDDASPQHSMEFSEPSNSLKDKNQKNRAQHHGLFRRASTQQIDSEMSQDPIVGPRLTKRKVISCDDDEDSINDTKSCRDRSFKTNSNLTRSLKRIKPIEKTPESQKELTIDTNALPQTPPSPTVSPISSTSKSPSVTQPNDPKSKLTETDNDIDSMAALKSEFPTPIISKSKRGVSDIKSLWVRDKERYYPAMLVSEKNSSIFSNKLKAVFKDGSNCSVQQKDLTPLVLEINQQIKYLKSSKVIYTIVELFDSTTEEGRLRLKEFKLQESQRQPASKSSRSKRAKQVNQQDESNSNDKPADSVKIFDNSGNDYAVLKETSSSNRKTSNKNQISSEPVLAQISELYLTRKLGLKYIKEMQPSQDSFASFDPAQIFNFHQVRAESTTTEEMPMSSIYFQNPKRKSAQISEGTYYESPDEDESNKFSIDDDLPLFTSNTRSIPSNSLSALEKLETVYPGIFSGCIFTITHTEKNQKDMKEEEKYVNNLEKKIRQQGGIVLVKGFKEILDINEKEFRLSWAKRRKPNSRKASTELLVMRASSYVPKGDRITKSNKHLPVRSATHYQGFSNYVDSETEDDSTLAINSKYRFAAVLANEATRTLKYMEGLALGIPCLSWQFVEDCIADQRFIDNWVDYVLSAGGSSVLGGVQKSLNVSNFLNIWLQNRSLYYQFLHRKPLLSKLKTPIYLIEDVNLALQLHQRGINSLPKGGNNILDRQSSGSTSKSSYNSTEPNKVFRSLLLMLGCEMRNLFVVSKISDILVDDQEGAIVIFNCAEEKLGKYSQTLERTHVNALNHKQSLKGAVLFFNREWILQSIINQRIV